MATNGVYPSTQLAYSSVDSANQASICGVSNGCLFWISLTSLSLLFIDVFSWILHSSELSREPSQ